MLQNICQINSIVLRVSTRHRNDARVQSSTVCGSNLQRSWNPRRIQVVVGLTAMLDVDLIHECYRVITEDGILNVIVGEEHQVLPDILLFHFLGQELFLFVKCLPQNGGNNIAH